MEEYKVECYISKGKDTLMVLEDNFSDKAEYNKWCKELEENALEEFYNRKINIITKDI